MSRSVLVFAALLLTLTGCGQDDGLMASVPDQQATPHPQATPDGQPTPTPTPPPCSLTGSYSVPVGQYCTPYQRDASVVQQGTSLSLVNECGSPTNGQMTGPNAFDSGWDVSASVSSDCRVINWSNGTVWSR